MASPRYTCGFGDCTFATDDIGELSAHDAATGHPNPDGDELAPARARVQQLCAANGGHEPSVRDPRVCGVCRAPILVPAGGRFRCRESGCDFSSDAPGALVVHDISTHPLHEVPASELPPLPVVPDLLAQADRALAQLRCGRSGHIPNPLNPAVCVACGAPLEVFRG